MVYPRFTGSKSAEDDRLLKEIKICTTIFFGGEIKPSA
jgi:hypothetical protein